LVLGADVHDGQLDFLLGLFVLGKSARMCAEEPRRAGDRHHESSSDRHVPISVVRSCYQGSLANGIRESLSNADARTTLYTLRGDRPFLTGKRWPGILGLLKERQPHDRASSTLPHPNLPNPSPPSTGER